MNYNSIPYKYHLRDNLTGALSRNTFLKLLEKEEKNARRTGKSFAVLCFEYDNLDEFFDINSVDDYNNIIVNTVDFIHRSIRQIDRVGMYNRQIILLLLSETNSLGAKSFAPRFRKNIIEQKFIKNPKLAGRKLTLSIGISIFPDNYTKKMSIIEGALKALKKAHQMGGDREIFSIIRKINE